MGGGVLTDCDGAFRSFSTVRPWWFSSRVRLKQCS